MAKKPSSPSSSSPLPPLVIRASAGTGKTFQLSNRYLGLVCRGQPPDQILAVTFARKAAREILDRVMVRLAEAALFEPKRRELADHLGQPDLDRARCLAVLGNLARNLHRLRIGTLDSFFNQLAGNFGLELGLPPGWQVVDAPVDQRLRMRAIQAVLQAESTSNLVSLMHLLCKGEITRLVTDEIRDVVAGLHDVYREAPAEAWTKLPRRAPLSDAEVERAVEQLAAFPAFTDKNFAKAHSDHVANAQARDWESFIEKGLASKILDDSETYCRKPIEPALAAVYRPLLAHVEAVLVNRLVNQNEAAVMLLTQFDAAYRQLQTEERALRFGDITGTLAEGLSSGRLNDVSFRLDAHVNHLLLDEFQDTSLAQWAVVKSFAKRAAEKDSGRSFFCVGDVKQAIYGWRGGVSEIFDAVAEELPGLTSQSLAKSYRSSQAVIDAVNSVFQSIGANEALVDHPAVAAAWKKTYEKHTTAKTDLAGYVRMEVAPRAAEGEKQPHATLKFAARRIAEIARQCPHNTIGVLVRRNVAVARLIYELRRNEHILASEEGGNPLTDSPAVQLILSLLRLADHPGDTAARFHVARSPLGEIVGLSRHDDAHEDSRAAARLAARIRAALMADGYRQTIHGWVRSLAPLCDARDLNRLVQLVELAAGYENDATLRADDFVNYVAQTKVEDPATAQVRVMTVHQAKGLEFDVVVLPELDVRVKGQHPPVVVGRARPIDPIDLVCRYAGEQVQQFLPPEVREVFKRWPNQGVSESLCLLYVALTRAVHALHVIIAPAAKNEKTLPKTLAGVVRAAWSPGVKAEPEMVLYEHGQADWHARVQARRPAESPSADGSPAAKTTVEPIAIRLKAGAPQRRRALDHHSPSSLEGGRKVDLAKRLRLDAAPALARGTLVHAWLELIEWLDDGEPADAALRDRARSIETAGLALDAEIAAFRKLLALPSVRQVMSRGGYAEPAAWNCPSAAAAPIRGHAPELEVWRERAFAIRQGDGLLQGTLDRCVLVHFGGRLLAADILDFKTDRVLDEASLATPVDFYRPQLEAYRRAVAGLTKLDPQRIGARLVFVGAGVVRGV